MRRRTILVTVILTVVVGFFVLSATPILSSFLPNVGLPFGYYGQFNRARHQLRQIDAVEIVDYHQHKDLRIEDFCFVLRTETGLQFDLQFSRLAKTREPLDRNAGLAVQDPSGKWLLYPFGVGERLEVAVRTRIADAVDVLDTFDRIAEVIEKDRLEGVPETEATGVPDDYLWIIFPSFFGPKPVPPSACSTDRMRGGRACPGPGFAECLNRISSLVRNAAPSCEAIRRS